MTTQKKNNAVWFFFILVCAVFFAAVWRRAYFGLDVTDESYWVAEPYLVTKGAVPFVDLWSQTPSTSLLIAPFVSAYLLLTGGTEGISLFLMLTAVIFRLAVSVGVWFLLRRVFGDLCSGVFSAALFCISNTGRGLNYNTISLYLLALGGLLVFRSLIDHHGKQCGIMPTLAGIIMACCALAHSTQVVNCAYFALLFLLLSTKKKNGWKKTLLYSGVGIGIALLSFAGLELAGHGGLISGIRLLLNTSNYFRIQHLSVNDQLVRSLNVLKHWGKTWIIGFLCAFAASLMIKLLFYRSIRLTLRRCFALALTGGGIVLLARAILYGVTTDHIIAVLFFTIPLFLPAIERGQRRNAFLLILCLWIPNLLSLLLIALFSHTPVDYRFFTLTVGALLYIPFSFLALESPETDEKIQMPFIFREFTAAPILLAFLTAVCFVKSSYENVYRDSPISELDYRISTGAYKGLYTSAENGQAIERLEESIREKTANVESVLICDLFPMGYLMTDAQHCTPTVWDPDMYRYGFQDMELFKAYFSRSGRTPEMILYIYSEENPLSIDDPENEFAAFVKSNYTLTYEEGEGRYALRVFERNEQG